MEQRTLDKLSEPLINNETKCLAFVVVEQKERISMCVNNRTLQEKKLNRKPGKFEQGEI